MNKPLSRWTLLAVLFVLLVGLDQWTKFLAVERLTTVFDRAGDVTLEARVRGFFAYKHLEPLATEPHVVWQPVWRHAYVENPGAAFSLFRNLSPDARNIFFTVVSLGAVAFILFTYRKLEEGQRYMQVSLALVLSGAVGNFIDRLARRYVIDFIEWHWWNRPDLRWPTFNVADSLIVVGVILLLLHPGSRKVAAPADKEAGAAAPRRTEA